MRKPKLFLAKGPLDDHSRPIGLLRKRLAELGIDILWTGLQQDWQLIVKTIVEEDPDIIGFSIHSGDPILILKKLLSLLKKENVHIESKVLVCGGSGEITFPDVQKKVRDMGFEIFLFGESTYEKMARYIHSEFEKKCTVRQKERPLEQTVCCYHYSRLNIGELITASETFGQSFTVPYLQGVNRSFRIVLAGPQRIGKSSVLAKLLKICKEKVNKIGVIQCDPGSKTNGATLLDRIVIRDETEHENIFSRSIAGVGGYDKASTDLLKKITILYSIWGARITFIETVGLGQVDEIKHLRELADLFLWVTLPDEGEDFQFAKYGPHSLSDAIVVNKTDLLPAFNAETAIRQQLEKPCFVTSAKTGDGIEALSQFILQKIGTQVDH
jgi:methylmalonyl-CoA mutase cobalamin-binding domain/chain